MPAKDNPLFKLDPSGALGKSLLESGLESGLESDAMPYSSSNDDEKFVPPQSPMVGKTKPNRLSNWLTLADGATRGLDAYSTRRALASGLNHEKVLPDIISHSTPGMYLYSGGITGVNYLGSKLLEKHGHPKLANALKIIDIGEDLPAAVNNLFLPTTRKEVNVPPPPKQPFMPPRF